MTPEPREAIERLKAFRDQTYPEHGEGVRTFHKHMHSQQARDDITALIAAIEAMEPRPIQEAPRDGTPFIALDYRNGAEYAVIVRYETDADEAGYPFVDLAEGQRYTSTFFVSFIPLSALPQPEVK